MAQASHPIEARDLVVRYGDRTALDRVTLAVPRGATFGFLGPNGAGKSTFIKVLLGLVFPSSGSALLNGLAPSSPDARRPLGYLPEEAAYPKFLTPRELVRFYGKLSGMTSARVDARLAELLPFVGLQDAADRRLGTFSKGMMQKVGLVQALVHDPDVLVLDEPTSGLDPVAKLHLREILRGLKARGKTIFFSSHELSEVELLCDSVAILSAGRLLRSGALADVVGHADGERNLERLFVKLVEGAK